MFLRMVGEYRPCIRGYKSNAFKVFGFAQTYSAFCGRLANQKLCYIQTLLKKENSGEQD